jgi:pyruvate/2-oxoglutarate dehydrogenase complex dihydrolipoamide dehydrogenase (E3) component
MPGVLVCDVRACLTEGRCGKEYSPSTGLICLPQAARRGRIGLEGAVSDGKLLLSAAGECASAEASVKARMEGNTGVLRAKTYDTIVIGTSWGDRLLPTAFAQAGRQVALIERDHLGGTCVNTGCTPTKTMVASARVAYLARHGADYGVHTGPISVAMPEVRQRKQGIVEGARSRFESFINDVDLLLGTARFIAPKTLEVQLTSGETQHITAPLIIINVGARPAPLSIPGIDSVSVLDSTSIIELNVLPDHLLIVGSGYVGLEFGQMFRRFGSQVTIIQRNSRLLMSEDEDVSDAVTEILREDGITVLTETTPERVEPLGDGRMQLTVRMPRGEQQLVGTHLLVAVGRRPNTEQLTPEVAGIQLDKHGYIQVNERLETSVRGIYALGDAKGGPAFTHVTYDDFRILRSNLLEHGTASTRGRIVPYTVFIDPQLGRVGMSENQARRQGRNVHVAKLPMKNVARALETGETRGFMKAVVDAETGQILGCAMLGLEGGEIMAIVQMAMLGKMPYTTLRDGMFTHPTLAEGLNSLFMTLDS